MFSKVKQQGQGEIQTPLFFVLVAGEGGRRKEKMRKKEMREIKSNGGKERGQYHTK